MASNQVRPCGREQRPNKDSFRSVAEGRLPAPCGRYSGHFQTHRWRSLENFRLLSHRHTLHNFAPGSRYKRSQTSSSLSPLPSTLVSPFGAGQVPHRVDGLRPALACEDGERAVTQSQQRWDVGASGTRPSTSTPSRALRSCTLRHAPRPSAPASLAASLLAVAGSAPLPEEPKECRQILKPGRLLAWRPALW
jgi:hypothetical protein